jgi:sterol desaturase/sphingolipid hydroxylase (fatty acid hydroxylase superfamily)
MATGRPLSEGLVELGIFSRRKYTSYMPYWIWLIGLSAIFTLMERLWPRRSDQRLLRRGIGNDMAYVLFNGHFLGLSLAYVTIPLEHYFNSLTQLANINIHMHLTRSWPWMLQFAVALLAIDFIQWIIHNLMHHVPWFWEFHKVHHSIEDLDWLGSLRFHWMEVALYKLIQYPFLALLGFNYHILFILAIASTAIGHFNHSNLRLNLGPLKYFLNSPEMHEWHHVHPNAGLVNKNFGINLSIWDWLFGTGYLPKPKSAPASLGFQNMDQFPKNILLQELWPLSSWLKPKK